MQLRFWQRRCKRGSLAGDSGDDVRDKVLESLEERFRDQLPCALVQRLIVSVRTIYLREYAVAITRSRWPAASSAGQHILEIGMLTVFILARRLDQAHDCCRPFTAA